MPIEHALWRIGDKPGRLPACDLASELELEDLICTDLSILSNRWLLIGRQVPTGFGKFIDLLALDQSGSLIIVELKKNKTPREVVAQAMDYASWVKDLDASGVSAIFDKNREKLGNGAESLDAAFATRFGTKLDEDDLDGSHQMVVVATDLDSSTERIIDYVTEYGIPLNVMFFRVFRDGDARYLSRAWLMDPAETQELAQSDKKVAPWNGEYYVSFGASEERSWEDARRYGFICGGGGKWYSRTLNMLT